MEENRKKGKSGFPSLHGSRQLIMVFGLKCILHHYFFLVATKRLYESVSVHRSVCPSIRNAFVMLSHFGLLGVTYAVYPAWFECVWLCLMSDVRRSLPREAFLFIRQTIDKSTSRSIDQSINRTLSSPFNSRLFCRTRIDRNPGDTWGTESRTGTNNVKT